MGYLKAQAIAYFIFSLLLVRRLAASLGASSSHQVDFSSFSYVAWAVAGIAGLCLVLSIFFLVAVFFKGPICKGAVKVALYLSLPFYTLLVLSFVTAWFGNISFVAGLPVIFTYIFLWSGLLVLAGLESHYVWILLRPRAK